MSELVYLRTTKGTLAAQIWHGKPGEYVGCGMYEVNGIYGDRVVRRHTLAEGEEMLRIDVLVERYPPL